ncbi:hypothetical protein GF345_00155 [Candidatus Woesearchaeota archaeon]|nr:hypothetical protein [Candidatus Woesearchaeota archaeon]
MLLSFTIKSSGFFFIIYIRCYKTKRIKKLWSPVVFMAEKELFKKAYDIAKRDLRACYADKGILAGLKRFDDYWARDSFFASLGALCIGDNKIVKKNLELFLQYQKPTGQLPRRIDRYHVGLKYLGIPVKRDPVKPKYTTSLGYCYSVDQNSLFIIALCEYVERTKDYSFLKKIYPKAIKVMDWNFSNDRTRDLLLEEGYFANWEDTIFWRGQLPYTNILHYWALECFAGILRKAGLEYKHYRNIAQRVKKRINDYFWNRTYYEKTKKATSKFLSVDANLIAIFCDVADRKKAEKIMDYIRKKDIDSDMPMKNSYPGYPLWRNSPTRLLTLTAGYHGSYGWIWISCFEILALMSIGRKKRAFELFRRLCSRIVEFDGVYEVYSKGKPVKGFMVESEQPFAWSAGLFLYAYEAMKKQKLLK